MKISRYNISCKLINGEYVICMRFSKKGKYVKFSDIVEVKKPDNQQLKEDICPECDGDGEVSWGIAKVKCGACKGTGIRSSI